MTFSALKNNQYEFTNTSTIKNGNLNFKWDLGDNTQKETKHITHSYSEANSFTVQMIAVSEQMCTDTFEKTIETKPDPIARFNIDNAEQCFLNNKFTLSNKSLLSKGKYDSYWEISDGFISSDKNIMHHFENPGTYAATLIVETEYNCIDTASALLMVNPMPFADFGINNQHQCLNENKFVFSNKSNISDGTLEYIWSFGNGEGSYDKNPVYRFHETDSFKICLKVLSDNGCIDSSFQFIRVNPSPVAKFITNAEGKCLEGNVFEFTNLSSIENGQIESVWHTGDNNVSKDFNLSHSFKSDGNYNVMLKVISEQNCADSTHLKVSVYPMPAAKFAIGQACLNENTYFLDRSNIKKPEFLSDWVWNFGNGDGAFTRNPVYQYKKPGTYKVMLSATSNHNCSSIASEYIKINPHIPQPSIEKTTIIDNQKILVEWKKPEGKNLVKYVLERRTNNQDYILIDSFEPTTTYFIDEKVNVNTNKYSYRLRSLDSCYYESHNSNVGSNILLHIDENEEYPLITWSKYPSLTNLNGQYEIYYLDSENLLPQHLTTVDATSDFFKDSLTNYNTSSYCYQVYAIKENEILSKSNIDCSPTLLTAFVPNIFTPNGDELNDIFKVKGKNILELTMYIYDKWGDLVFYTENIDEGWDGRYMNKDLPTDTYKYIIQLKGVNDQTREFIGYVSLFR
jgi:gliding motility-associated-like protein